MEYITQEVFTTKDTEISQRVINHWDKEGLLPRQSKFEGQWRRFSFVDYLWIKFIEELRAIGMPLATIKHIKNGMFDPISSQTISELLKEHPEIIDNLPDDEFKPVLLELFKNKEYEKVNDQLGYSSFHMLVADIIGKKENTKVLVFQNGEWLLWNEKYLQQYHNEDLQKVNMETYVSVSVMNIIKNFISKDHKLELTPKLRLFEDHKMKLLEIINSGKYESLKVIPRNKELEAGEIPKKDNKWRKTIDLLMGNQYQEIQIKSSKGVIMKIQNTIT